MGLSINIIHEWWEIVLTILTVVGTVGAFIAIAFTVCLHIKSIQQQQKLIEKQSQNLRIQEKNLKAQEEMVIQQSKAVQLQYQMESLKRDDKLIKDSELLANEVNTILLNTPEMEYITKEKMDQLKSIIKSSVYLSTKYPIAFSWVQEMFILANNFMFRQNKQEVSSNILQEMNQYLRSMLSINYQWLAIKSMREIGKVRSVDLNILQLKEIKEILDVCDDVKTLFRYESNIEKDNNQGSKQ